MNLTKKDNLKLFLVELHLRGMSMRSDDRGYQWVDKKIPVACFCTRETIHSNTSSYRVFKSEYSANLYIIPCTTHLTYYLDRHEELE